MCTKHTESTATEPKSKMVTDTRWNPETMVIKHCADPTGTQNVYTSERTREKERGGGGGEKKRKGVGGSERERRDAFYWITLTLTHTQRTKEK